MDFYYQALTSTSVRGFIKICVCSKVWSPYGIHLLWRAVTRITACLNFYSSLLFFQVCGRRNSLPHWIDNANNYKHISAINKKLSVVKSPEATITKANQMNEKWSHYLKYPMLFFQKQKYTIKVIRTVCTWIHLFYSQHSLFQQ